MLNESLFADVSAELMPNHIEAINGEIHAHCVRAVYVIALTKDDQFLVTATNDKGEVFTATQYHLEGAIDEARAQVLAAR